MRGRLILAALIAGSIPVVAATTPQQRDPRAPIAPAQTGTGSISGVVTDRRQAPLTTAIVRIAIEGVPTKREAMTDAGGRFRFVNLPAGRYAISAHKAGYLDEWFGRSASGPASELIALAPGQAIDDVSIALTRTGAIGGVVTGDTGEPIRAAVRLMPRNRPSQEEFAAGIPISATTDGRGRYRIGALPPGEYFVIAHSMESTDARTFGSDGRDRQFSFIDTYFPGSVRQQDASPVRVNEGEVASDINIQVSTAPAGTAEGQLTHVSGLPVQGQQVAFVAKDRIRFSAIPIDGGRFRIAGLPYGEYDVLASGTVKPESASMQIGWARGAAVIGPNRVNLALTLTPGGAMSGRVSTEDGAPAAGVKIRVTATGAVPAAMGTNLLVAPVADDGTFAFANLAPGRYLVGLEPAPKSPLSVGRVEIGGQHVADAVVELVGGLSLDGVHLSLIDTHADISGTVTASDGRPVVGALVAAFPDGPILSAGRTAIVTTDSAGRYLLASVPLGRYRLEAVTPGPVIQTIGGPTRPDAVFVVIDARGQKKVVDFRR